MTSGLLGKWFGGRPAAPAPVADALAELEKISQARPSLAASCAVLREVLPEIFAVPVVETSVVLDPTSAANRLAEGVPLLRGEEVGIDGPSLGRRWLAVCKAVERNDHAAARKLADASASLDPPGLLAELLAGRPEAVHAGADALQLDAALAATVLRLAAFPVLAKFTRDLAPMRRASPWGAGYCPTCGSWPLLGEFRGLEQIRFLRCGWCASDWEFARLRCPFCDNRDHRQLGYLHIEGEENRFRAATCDVCRGYVKMVSTLAPLSEPQLLVMDLATLHLDLAAANQGFFVA